MVYERDRTVMHNRKSIHFEIVRRSPIAFKIKKVAANAFSVWRNYVQNQYPNYLFKADVEMLAKDMQHSFGYALESLFEEKSEERSRNIPGWSNGYIQGFVPANICTHWYNEYVFLETNDYKQLLLLKTIIMYFGVDFTTMHRIEKLYNYLIGNKTDIPDKESYKSGKVVDFCKLKSIKNQNSSKEFTDLCIKYLESLMLEKYFALFDNITKSDSYFKISDYFDPNEIDSLIIFYTEEMTKCRKKVNDKRQFVGKV